MNGVGFISCCRLMLIGACWMRKQALIGIIVRFIIIDHLKLKVCKRVMAHSE